MDHTESCPSWASSAFPSQYRLLPAIELLQIYRTVDSLGLQGLSFGKGTNVS